ncbi:hypothetical protein [Ottowia sp.]|uniref:hypothetical protein n=1 Tax=Ottowia sp. TaxID=1898956 RepID=UPI0025DBC904|nr:hypothetical protein [Ottowia sp.]MBK6616636.1 hypothetical protein [Ottowia sp.]
MKGNITVNAEQKLYVIPGGGGYSCFGFDNARLHTMQILLSVVSHQRQRTFEPGEPTSFDLLEKHPLNFTDADYGQLSGYSKYQQAVQLWGQHFSSQTYFDPGTNPALTVLLEQWRLSGRRVRLFMGDSETGRDWMEEYDLVGRIGRSCGTMKVPLLVPSGEDGGGAILTSCVVRVLDAQTLQELYRHPKYQAPKLVVVPDNASGYKFRVDREGVTHARFKTNNAARGYVAFMLGQATSTRSIR